MQNKKKRLAKNRIMNAFIASLLVVTLTGADFFILGKEVVAASVDMALNLQTEMTTNKNVKFDTFFKKDNEKSHYLICDVNEQNSEMYMNLSVEEGYLKNAVIELSDNNYLVKEYVDDSGVLQEVANNKITLKQVNSQENINVIAKIIPNIEEKTSLSEINKESKVILKATYINNKGQEVNIEKEVKINVGFTQNAELELTQNVNSYVMFKKDNQDKVLIKILAKLNLTPNTNNLPLKDTVVTAKVPMLNGMVPESVSVLPKNTEMTNGQKEETVKYDQEQIEYNKETGVISIKVENEEIEGKVSLAKGQDEYMISYVYPKEAVANGMPTISSSIDATAEIITAEGIKSIVAKAQDEWMLTEEIGKVVSLELGTNTNSLSKGKMYANSKIAEKQYETEYNTEWKIDISSKDVLNTVKVEDKSEYFVDNNGNKYALEDNTKAYTHYTKTIVNKNNFESILGQDGIINIYNKGNLIAQINNETAQDENGNYIVSYPENTDKISIETSKVQSEGILYINNYKEIAKDLPYEKAKIQEFSKIESEVSLSDLDGMLNEQKTLSIELNETNTNANIVLDKTSLSTIVTNEDVDIKIELNNHRIDSDLYENPVFLIELPEYVEDIEVKEANILYDENLQIQSMERIEQGGKIYIKIELSGIQNGFSSGSFTNGTNIVLKTNIKVKLLTPNKEDKIKLYYSNQNAISYESPVQIGDGIFGEASANINYSAPTGMLAVNRISGYESTGKSIISVNQGTITDKIAIYENAKNSKMEVKIINNTGNNCSNIYAIGRIPFKGNKNINSDQDLGTTVDTILTSRIIAENVPQENVVVYYSENGEASNDLTDPNNAWAIEPADFSKVKSYLIVLNNYELKAGNAAEFSYTFEIPANLEYENNIFGAFGTYFDNNDEILGVRAESSVADLVGLKTGEGPKLEVSQVLLGEENSVQVGQIAKVVMLIDNKGSSDVENVKVREYIPKYAKYTEYQKGSGDYGEVPSGYIYPQTSIEAGTNKEYIDIDVGTIKAGKTTYVEFELYITEIPNNIIEYYGGTEGLRYDQETQKYYIDRIENGEVVSEEITKVPEIKLVNEVSISAKDLENNLVNTSNEITIKDASLRVEEKSSIDSRFALKEGQEISYIINIQNTSDNTLVNTVASKALPEGLYYKEAYVCKYSKETGNWVKDVDAIYNKDTKTISWNIGTMASKEYKQIKVVAEAAKLVPGVYEKEITTKTTVKAEAIEECKSIPITNVVAKANLLANMTTNNTKEYIAEGEEITYTITIKNNGKTSAGNIEFKDLLPNELRFIRGTYLSTNGQTGDVTENDNIASFITTINPDEVITVTIVAAARNIPNDQAEVTIKNSASVVGNEVGAVTNEITTRIEQSPELPNPQDEGNNTNTGNNGNNGNSGNNGNNTNIEKSFRIRGTVWVDLNSNSARDKIDQGLEGIQVILTNALTGEIVKDKDSKTEKKVTTGQDGSYVFENLEKGEYIVVFEYNKQAYKLADYKKSGVADNLNSDVIAGKLKIDGEEKEVAVTDTIKLTTTSYANIDMGLIYANQFDIKLDKFVSKVTLQNKEGVKTYNFTDSSIAQLPITAKRMQGSTVVAEYKIKVTNEGNVAGFVKNVVDYIPKEMTFSSNLNPNWYAGNDGNLYNKELENTLISPGETKEVSLVLTKQVGEAKSVIVNNLAEVYEDYNELGIADIDSKTKNRAQGEDDLGSANLIITIRTGAEVTYTVVILISLILIACGIFVIRKRNERYYN